jgi:hypothetical protein
MIVSSSLRVRILSSLQQLTPNQTTSRTGPIEETEGEIRQQEKIAKLTQAKNCLSLCFMLNLKLGKLPTFCIKIRGIQNIRMARNHKFWKCTEVDKT